MKNPRCVLCMRFIKESEHYVTTEKGKVLCEECFFDDALEYLGAELHQLNTTKEEKV